uniref:Ig-like domain-containing protein n=1 Tax=Sinocyclocheilus anshuiensis TaxID=1608454 RepID=A0A671P5J8_9TELE
DPTIELAVVPSVSRSSLDPQKLLCSATGFDPKIKWLSVSDEKTGRALDAAIMEDGRVKVFSEILVTQQEWNQGITCQTKTKTATVGKSTSICTGKHAKCDRNPLSIINIAMRCRYLIILYQRAEFYLVGPSLSSVRSDTSVYLTCLVVGQSVKLFSIQWKVNGIVPNPNGHEQEPRVHDNGTESKESILKVLVTDWNAYALFTCEVKHLSLPLILRPSDSDLSGLQNACLLCLITGFFPSDISVQWLLNETQLDASQFTNSPVATHTSGGFSMHSALMLPASEWKDGTFSCVVSHESSQNPITVYTCEVTHVTGILSPNISTKTGTLDFKY